MIIDAVNCLQTKLREIFLRLDGIILDTKIGSSRSKGCEVMMKWIYDGRDGTGWHM